MNLLRDLPDARVGEVTETLVAAPGLRIERIVSQGQASPPGFWYDQPEAEWVLLLAGAARLRFADEAEERVLAPGDHVLIAPHRRHRVAWTDPATPTVWLAVSYQISSRPFAMPGPWVDTIASLEQPLETTHSRREAGPMSPQVA